MAEKRHVTGGIEAGRIPNQNAYFGVGALD